MTGAREAGGRGAAAHKRSGLSPQVTRDTWDTERDMATGRVGDGG